MRYFPSKLVFGVTLALLIVPLIVFGQSSRADLIASIQAQIAALQAQLRQLVNQSGGENVKWCHDFSKNLRVGDRSSDVDALHNILQKEGFGIAAHELGGHAADNGDFLEGTASAVVGFQEKYKEEILAPNGLARGTGYVGPSTRKKLNQLYGCGGGITPPIGREVIYKVEPSGVLIRGKEYNFNAKVSNASPNTQILFYLQRPDGTMKYNGQWARTSLGSDAAGLTDYSGNWRGSWLANLTLEGQNGIWTSWVTIGGVISNKEYHRVVEKDISVCPAFSPPPPGWCSGGTVVSGGVDENGCARPPRCAVGGTTEQVKCVFNGASTEQKCYTATDYGSSFSCSGVGACVVDVSGSKGSIVTWKSSCGGYAYTTIDGLSEYAEFKCGVSTQSSITVTSPSGGETYKAGGTFPIYWKSSDQNMYVDDINLVEYRQPCGNSMGDACTRRWGLVRSLKNNGYYEATIPLTVLEGRLSGYVYSYYVEVNLRDERTGNKVGDQSDEPFTIMSGGTTGTFSIADITGNTTAYREGELIKLVIKGVESDGTPGTPSEGFNVQVYTKNIATGEQVWPRKTGGNPDANANFDGAYWVFSATEGLKDGNYEADAAFYCSRDDSTCAKLYGRGAQVNRKVNFSISGITQPSVTVLSPNGGEVFQKGVYVNITWKNNFLTNNQGVQLQLWDETGSKYLAPICSFCKTAIPTGDAGYGWYVTNDLADGRYRIRASVVSALTNDVTASSVDFSDSPFSIVSLVSSYPGFNMKTDKSSYALNEVALLTLSRADGKTDPYFIDVYAMKPDGSNKVVIFSNLGVGQNTVGKISLSVWPVFTQGGVGQYLFATCPAGCKYGSDNNTNSVAFSITSPPVSFFSGESNEYASVLQSMKSSLDSIQSIVNGLLGR